ncbi:MAG TPA: hypothetical protein VJU14_02520 [Solirubrobacterales bacterium]|nr:hypothetical protein [Solirubrobacterales bacterium]
MAKKGGGSAAKEAARKARRSSCEALRHPMRVRILEVVNETPMSPIRFVNQGLHKPVRRDFKNQQNALSLVAYHFRALEKAGCIEITKLNPKRGATEHVYRGLARVFFSDEEFEALPLEDRKSLSRTSFLGLLARTDGAIQSGTFDKRTDRHLTWRALHLDPRGYREMMALLAGTYYSAEQIRTDAAARIAHDSDEEVIPFTFGILGFESPPQPDLH